MIKWKKTVQQQIVEGKWQKHGLTYRKIDDDIYSIRRILLKWMYTWAKQDHFALIFQQMKPILEYLSIVQFNSTHLYREKKCISKTICTIIIILQIKCIAHALQLLLLQWWCMCAFDCMLSTVETKSIMTPIWILLHIFENWQIINKIMNFGYWSWL